MRWLTAETESRLVECVYQERDIATAAPPPNRYCAGSGSKTQDGSRPIWEPIRSLPLWNTSSSNWEACNDIMAEAICLAGTILDLFKVRSTRQIWPDSEKEHHYSIRAGRRINLVQYIRIYTLSWIIRLIRDKTTSVHSKANDWHITSYRREEWRDWETENKREEGKERERVYILTRPVRRGLLTHQVREKWRIYSVTLSQSCKTATGLTHSTAAWEYMYTIWFIITLHNCTWIRISECKSVARMKKDGIKHENTVMHGVSSYSWV